MKFYKNNSIRKQILILAFTMIFMVVITQIAYYVAVSSFATKQSNQYVDESLKNINRQLEKSMNSIMHNATLISTNQSVKEILLENDSTNRYALSKYIYDYMSYMISSPYISDIILMDNQDRRLAAVNRLDPTSERELIKEVEASQQWFYWTGTKKTLSNYNYTALGFKIYEQNNIIGIGIIITDAMYYQETLKSNLLSQEQVLILLDDNDILLSTNSNKNDILFSENKDYFNNNLNDYLLNKYIVSEHQWEIISYIPKDIISEDYDFVKNTIVIMGIVFISIMLIWMTIIVRNIYYPIRSLKEYISKSTSSKPDTRYNFNTNNEILTIKNTVNNMLDTIEINTRKIFQQQTEMHNLEMVRKEIQLMNFFAQINPHFLYNTLETIRGLGVINEENRIVNITTSLAALLRYSIKSDSFVLVKKEEEAVKNYLNIINIRYNEEIAYTIDIDKSLHDEKIIKMIIQPFVENAIKHGYDLEKPMTIQIKLTKEHHKMRLTIADNGLGMKNSKINEIYQRFRSDYSLNKIDNENIGLFNTFARLKLLYGNEFNINDFIILSEEDIGTIITIYIPIIKSN